MNKNYSKFLPLKISQAHDSILEQLSYVWIYKEMWNTLCNTVADPGFPVGGRGLPRRLRFENFVCRNERIWTLRGRAPGTPPRSANATHRPGEHIKQAWEPSSNIVQ